jgi:hypothetical protein
MVFKKTKNDTINSLGEYFETLMKEIVNSGSRIYGAGIDDFTKKRATDFINQVIFPTLNVPLQDTPIVASRPEGDEDPETSPVS